MAKFSITPGDSPSPVGIGEQLAPPVLAESQAGLAGYKHEVPTGSTPSILDGTHQEGGLPAYDGELDNGSAWLADVRDDDGLVVEAGSARRGWADRLGDAVRSLRPVSQPTAPFGTEEAPVFNDPGLTRVASHLSEHHALVEVSSGGPEVVVVEDFGSGASEGGWNSGPVVWSADEGMTTMSDTRQAEPAWPAPKPSLLPAPSFPSPTAIDALAEAVAPNRTTGLVGALKVSATEYRGRREASRQAANELAEWRREREAAEVAAAQEALNTRLAELRLQDERTIAGVVGQLTDARAQMGPIESNDFRHLPTLAMASERVRVLTAGALSSATAGVSSERVDRHFTELDLGLYEQMQTTALLRQVLAANELAAARSRQARIDDVTDPVERQQRIMMAANQTAATIAEAQAAILPDVYINPHPEGGVTHREYAFNKLVEIAGVPEGRAQVIDGTRQTQVLARMEVGNNGMYNFVPGQDGISPLLARCGDASRGESVFLGNVVPGGLDGRASGVVVRRPGDTYEGGFVLEVRYAGKTPIEPDYGSNALPDGAELLAPAYDAVFDVEARHFSPGSYHQVMASDIAGHGADGPRAFVDPRMLPLFEGQATLQYALPRYQEYANSVAAAHTAGLRAQRESLASAGFGTPMFVVGRPELGSGH